VVTVTKGYHHESIAVAEPLLADLAERTGEFTVDYARTDEDLARKMSSAGLQAYEGVLFANTSGDLPIPDPQAFVDWVRAGHSYVGVHAAADTYHHFPPYLEMLGAEFLWHGAQVGVTVHNIDPGFPGLEDFGPNLEIPLEEMYVFQKFQGDQVHLLLYLDQHPNDQTPGLYPLAWSRQFGEGRVFYTAFGHRDDIMTAPWFVDHLLGGIRWALGLAAGSATPRPLPEI